MTTTTANGVAVREMSVPTGALAIPSDAETLTDAQIEAFGLKEASRGERMLFIHTVQKTGLDPAARQIYMIGRNQKDGDRWIKKFTIQTGIDGYRLIARRAASRSRQDLSYGPTEWCGHDGVWCEAWLSDGLPAAARVTVFRDGNAFPAVALFREYKQETKYGLTDMWKRMPANQLAKCVEGLALRKAFPQELSGLYVEEEMQQADSYDGPRDRSSKAPRYAQVRTEDATTETADPGVTVTVESLVTTEQANRIVELLNLTGMPSAQRLDYVAKTVDRPVKDPSQLTGIEAEKLIGDLEEMVTQQQSESSVPSTEDEFPPPSEDPTVNGEMGGGNA